MKRDTASASAISMRKLASVQLQNKLSGVRSVLEIQNKIPELDGLSIIPLNIMLGKIKSLSDKSDSKNAQFINQIFRRQLNILKHERQNPFTLSVVVDLLELCNDPTLKNQLLETLVKQIYTCEEKFKVVDIAIILHCLNEKDPAVCREMIQALTAKLRDCKEPFTAKDAAMSFYGLNGQDLEVCREIIQELTAKLRDCKDRFTVQQIAMSLYGLSGQGPVVCRETIQELTAKLRDCKDPFTAQHISMSLYGLKGQDLVVCREIIQALSKKTRDCKDQFMARSFAISLYGLNGQDPVGCRKIIQELTIKLRDCKDRFTAQNITMSLYGLNKQDPAVCREIIQELTVKLRDCKESFTAEYIAMSLYGLNEQDPAMCREIIQELTVKLRDCKEPFTAQHIAMSLYGLNGQDPAVCREIIEALIAKTRDCKDVLNTKHLAMVLNGIRDHFSTFETLDEFFSFLKSSIYNETIHPSKDNLTVNACLQNLCLFNYVYKKNYSKDIPDFLEMKNALMTLYERLDSSEYKMTDEERRIGKILRTHYSSKVFENSKVLDGIEMDIYCNDPKINIEVDGSQHSWSRTDALRDEYLREVYGIETLRIHNGTSETAALKMTKTHMGLNS